jgi:hypothetical protein
MIAKAIMPIGKIAAALGRAIPLTIVTPSARRTLPWTTPSGSSRTSLSRSLDCFDNHSRKESDRTAPCIRGSIHSRSRSPVAISFESANADTERTWWSNRCSSNSGDSETRNRKGLIRASNRVYTHETAGLAGGNLCNLCVCVFCAFCGPGIDESICAFCGPGNGESFCAFCGPRAGTGGSGCSSAC